MKLLTFAASILLAITLPAHAAEYGGKTIDGTKLPAKVYSSATGGVFEAQVEFQRDRATIYFVNGGQLVLRLSQPIIRDPNHITGYGRAGQIPLGR